ncbi:MAG TPA: response regulator transcription factor [Pseudonocardiaceae bacterium]|nr:response regulator transcription factor [Pseudonocardiaceae bacterium]
MVESATLVGVGVKAVVDADPTLSWIGCRDTTAAAVQLCRTDPPDVVVIGSWLDRHWKVCQILTDSFRDLAVIVVLDGSANNFRDITRARMNGARGFVPIDADIRNFPLAVQAAVRDGYYVAPDLDVSPPTTAAEQEEPPKPLSRREFEVLQLIAEGRTAGNIGSQLGITADTVRTHVGHILRKLRARDRAHAVARAFETSLLRINGVCDMSAASTQDRD